MHQASFKDMAVYFQRALATGLCHTADVEGWAAGMIAQSAGAVPWWMQELSIDSAANKQRLLGAVPGESNDDFVWRLLCARLGQSFRERCFTPGQVVYLLLSWAAAGTLPEEYRRAAYLFDDHHEGIGPGWFAEEALRKEMAAFFEQFRSYEPLLPTAPQPRSV